MGIEAAPPNEFRATMRSGRKPLVVADKHAKVDDSAAGVAAGLGAVPVPRSESRRTNQRDGDRHRLTDEQVVVRRKGKDYVVELINVSHGGAMVGGKLKAKLWDPVELVLGDPGASDGSIECAVRWIRGDRYGLEFAHETRVDCDSETLDELLRNVIRTSFPGIELKERPPTEGKTAEQRLLVRHPLIWSGVLHHDYEWEVVRLRNISSGGALIECPLSMPSGVTVYLELDNIGRLAATVTWSRENQTGLAFERPFDVSTLSKATPEIATNNASRSHFAPYGRGCDQSPWAPQWDRASIEELSAKLGG